MKSITVQVTYIYSTTSRKTGFGSSRKKLVNFQSYTPIIIWHEELLVEGAPGVLAGPRSRAFCPHPTLRRQLSLEGQGELAGHGPETLSHNRLFPPFTCQVVCYGNKWTQLWIPLKNVDLLFIGMGDNNLGVFWKQEECVQGVAFLVKGKMLFTWDAWKDLSRDQR